MKLLEIIPLKENYQLAREQFNKEANADLDDDNPGWYIEKFKTLHNRLSGKEKDINYWRKQGWKVFKEFVDAKLTTPSKTKIKRHGVVGESVNLFENDDWLILVPIDEHASCFHGKHTDWCISKPTDNYFNFYSLVGKTMIFVISKTDKFSDRYAIVVNLEERKIQEIRDERDSIVSVNEFYNETRLNRIAILNLALKKEIEIKKLKTKMFKKQALSTPGAAIMYAKNILHGRFPEAEDIISKDEISAYMYAKDVLHDRFPEGEKVISLSPMYSYQYALNVLHGRFAEGEKAISQHAAYSFLYAKDVLHDRFPEGEKIISLSPLHAYQYARFIIHGRFPEGEDRIASNYSTTNDYIKYVLNFADINNPKLPIKIQDRMNLLKAYNP